MPFSQNVVPFKYNETFVTFLLFDLSQRTISYSLQSRLDHDSFTEK